MIYAFSHCIKKPFFSTIFKIQDLERHYYEVLLDYELLLSVLKKDDD